MNHVLLNLIVTYFNNNIYPQQRHVNLKNREIWKQMQVFSKGTETLEHAFSHLRIVTMILRTLHVLNWTITEELDGVRLIHKIMTRPNGDIALKIALSVIWWFWL